MFKWLGRNQSQKALNEVTEWIKLNDTNIQKIREPLGYILMKLFEPLPNTYRDEAFEKLDTKLYFLRVMLPKNMARVLGGNIFKKADLIETKSGKNEEYYAHKLLCAFVHMISQIQGSRSSTARHVFEINEGTPDFDLFIQFDKLIKQIFKGHEKYVHNPSWDYIDNISTTSPMYEWRNYGN